MHTLVPHPILVHLQERCFWGECEAASIFVDISGFTALTETLMQHKKGGAEALTESLNTIFRSLVQAVYAQEGIITTFAGDAFTAIFPVQANQEEAALRAARTAVSIQQFFLVHNTIETPYGIFPVNVKIGLGIGQVVWGILGNTSEKGDTVPLLTYFFRGQAIDRCAQAEHEAGRGEIMMHHIALEHIQASVSSIFAKQGNKHLSIQKPDQEQPRENTPVVPHDAQKLIRSFIPDRVIELAGSSAQGEFRQVTIAFLSFQEPADHHVLNIFASTVLMLTEAYDGYFNKLDFGDKGGVILLIFGAPRGHERDIERATDALLTLREWEPPVRWRAGLTCGTVYAGMVGGDERAEYTAIGDVVNLAARLMMKADWGKIWANSSVADQLQAKGYNLEWLGSFAFKGKVQPVQVSQVISRPVVEETGLYQGQLVGRLRDIDRITQWIWPIFRGNHAGFLTMYGEAGLGKSRLAYEMRQRLLDTFPLRWFICPADNVLRQSLNPFRYTLRNYFQQSLEQTSEMNRANFTHIWETLVASVSQMQEKKPVARYIASELKRTRSFLGAMVDLSWDDDELYEWISPQLRFENTLQALKVFFLAESLRQPVVFQIENLQWLDENSFEMLKQLSYAMHDFPLAVLCLSRYHDDGSKIEVPVSANVPQQFMELSSFGAEETRSFAEAILAGSIGENLLNFLVQKTSGNPFFIEQITLDLHERGAISQDEHQCWSLNDNDTINVPVSITAVLVARLDRLNIHLRQVVQTASVLGREFIVHVLSTMLDNDTQVLNHIHQVEQERIWTLFGDERCVFLHSLLRDTIYEMQLQARLADLHTLAAETIELLYANELASYYPDLAYHYGRAGKSEQERLYSHRAGEQAANLFANVEAIAHLSRALHLTPNGDLVAHYTLLGLREQVYDRLGRREEQSWDLANLALLARQMQDRQRQADIALRQSHYGVMTGCYFMAILAAKQAIAYTRLEQTGYLQAKGYLEWGKALRWQAQYQQAKEKLEHALSLVQSGNFSDLEAEVLHQLGTIAYFEGNYDDAIQFDEHALLLYRSLHNRQGEANTLDSLGSDACDCGDFEKAISYYKQALEIYRAIGNQWGIGNTLGNLGQLYREQGAFSRAMTCFEEGLRICQAIGDQKGTGWFYSNLGWIYLDLGVYEQAEHSFETALLQVRAIGARGEESWILASMGLLAYFRGDYAAAQTHSQLALEIARKNGEPFAEGDAILSLGHAHRGAGLLAEAADCYEQALAIWRDLEMGSRVVETQAGHALIALARGDLAQAHEYVEEILSYQQENTSFAGADCPFLVFETCYRVLSTNHDNRATDVLLTATTLLYQQAQDITDGELRRSFLEDIPVNRRLLDASKLEASGTDAMVGSHTNPRRLNGFVGFLEVV